MVWKTRLRCLTISLTGDDADEKEYGVTATSEIVSGDFTLAGEAEVEDSLEEASLRGDS